MAVSLRQKGGINYAVMYRTSKAEGGAASVSFLECPANIRIIRILEYNFAHACIPLSEYEANGYCQQVRAFKSSIIEQNPSTCG